MAVGFIVGLIIFIACVFSFVISFKLGKKNFTKGKTNKIGVILGFVFAVTFILIPTSFHTVDTGEVAVVKHLGEAKAIRTAGTYFDFWITNQYDLYDAKVQDVEISTMAYSKDAQTMELLMTVQFQIDSTKAIEIAKQYGDIKILSNRIQSIAIEKTKSVLSSYSAMDIIQTRSTISPMVEESIKNAVDEEYFVHITAVVLTNIDFSDAFEKTVEDKMIAEQEKLKAQYEKETAIVNAEKELEVAKLAAEAKLEGAKADAQAQIEIANAEAMAIQLKSIEVARALGFTIIENVQKDEDGKDVVTYTIDFTGKSAEEVKLITDYLKYVEYLSKWNGELPSVVTGSDGSIIIPNP